MAVVNRLHAGLGPTAVFDKLADPVVCCGHEGDVIYANPAACRLFDLSSTAEFAGQRLWQPASDPSGDPFHRAFEQAALSGEAEQFEHFHSRWGRWYDNHVQAVGDLIWLMGRDVTAQKLATHRLEVLTAASRAFAEAASNQRTIFEQIARHVAEVLHDFCVIRLLSADGIRFEAPVGLWDEDPVFLALLRRLPSVGAGEAVGSEVLQAMRPIVFANVEPAAVAARMAPATHRHLAEQLGIHSLMVVPLRAQGNVLGTLSLGRRQAGTATPFSDLDLTLLVEIADRAALTVHQWRTFRLVEESRRRLIAIGDSLPALVSLIDRNERYQFVNAAYHAWFGYEPTTIVGRTLRDVLGDAAYAAIAPHVATALSGETVSFEARLAYSSGVPRDVHATYTPQVVDGSVEGFVALVVDVTDKARLQTELRTAIESRDEFLSIASHELRTPLTVLKLQLDGLARGLRKSAGMSRESEGYLKKVTMSLRHTDRLTKLVEGLLDVSRIRMGTFKLEPTEFDLVALLREVVERMEDSAKRANCEVVLLSPESAAGRWDRTRLDQTLTNLIANSLKYGQGKPVGVELRAFANSVTITITDAGIGIPPEDLSRIFGRFERTTPADHYSGLGLGLYIANEVVKAHGGAIDAKSVLGQGATFTISLPRHATVDHR